jgi:predicted HAD superfamily phosphohydrolase YqeG
MAGKLTLVLDLDETLVLVTEVELEHYEKQIQITEGESTIIVISLY